MSQERFPIERLVPRSAEITRRADKYRIAITTQPFELDGETEEREIILEDVTLPSNTVADLPGQTLRFPINPNDGFIDGSIYLRHAHNPVDVTSISFGERHGELIDTEFEMQFVFEFEGIGFDNVRTRMQMPLKIKV